MLWVHHPDRALDAFCDGELEGRAATRVLRHLRRCDPCRRRVVLARRVRASLLAMTRRER